MASERVALLSMVMFSALTSSSSWTVDLPEVRKYYFTKYSPGGSPSAPGVFDNIHPDSPHHRAPPRPGPVYGAPEPGAEHYLRNTNPEFGRGEPRDAGERYAERYQYQGYMEKKVRVAVAGGGVYLAGLSAALERYDERLRNCSQPDTNTSSPWLPRSELPSPPRPEGLASSASVPCASASSLREHARRLAALALWGARELQDEATQRRYEPRGEAQARAEAELVVLVASLLERLARLTGYDPPEPAPAPTPGPGVRTTTPRPAPLSLASASPEDTLAMMRCLSGQAGPQSGPQSGQAAPAYERCRFPPLTNTTDATPPPTPATPELLVPSETRTSSPLKSVKKRSIADDPLLHVVQYYVKHKVWDGSNTNPDSDASKFDVSNDLTVKSIHKRSIIINKKAKLFKPEDPMQDISAYVKHKTGVNYERNSKEAEKIRVFLEKIMKHSAAGKDTARRMEKIGRVRRRSADVGVARNSLADVEMARNSLADVGVARNSLADVGVDRNSLADVGVDRNSLADVGVDRNSLADVGVARKRSVEVGGGWNLSPDVGDVRNLSEEFGRLRKRSVHYGHVVFARPAQNPQQDISYYVKSRSGTRRRPDAVQAAQVRLGLEQVFQTGNIEVVRRYGANYNPAVPNAVLAGAAESVADV